MHGTLGPAAVQIDSAILYFGTPVVLIGSTNDDGSHNLAPMSSAWWVGWRCMLGLARNSKTTENMIRTGECVLNLPSADMAGQSRSAGAGFFNGSRRMILVKSAS
ncbi:flavin reductase family protein [Bradyrhizobium liaoningense]|uniref:flavin reductase family protein n=1 Tax=Bradyrhizobium liaoningense TaxID=43992 RepID=UPI0039089175